MWQMGGLGPMLGQNNHFRHYAPETLPYAVKRYEDETHRLFGVLNKRLADREFLAGSYSIADMACVGWARGYERQGIDIAEFPHVKLWLDTLQARPAVMKGLKVAEEVRNPPGAMQDPRVRAVLFNQRARA